MKFRVSAERPEKVKASLLAVGSSSARIKTGTSLARLDKKMKGALGQTLKREGFKGKVGESKLIHTHGLLPCHAILVLGTVHDNKGDLAPNALEIVRQAASRAARTANQRKDSSMAIDLSGWSRRSFSESDKIRAAVEGASLGIYKFNTYLKKDPASKLTLQSTDLLSPGKGTRARRAIQIGQAVAEGTNLARDLINTPAGDMTPVEMGRRARKVGPGVRTRVYTKREIVRMRMGSFLAVADGSVEPPTLIHMIYRPKSKSKKMVAIVGKGVTFDSGGLSLKPPVSMETMKDDMSGAASAIGLMQTLAQIRPRVTVHAVIAATENMPSGSAVKPGDIAKAMNGKTIEILNTDAEGRLTLADALHFAIQKKPDVVIDMATLTGACLVALGERCSGLMGNDEKLLKAIEKAADKSGEMVWRLPLIDEYFDAMKSPIADLKNIGGRWGGTIEAGLFLREFVGKARWTHIDIAGPSWASKELAYCPRGGTGCMVNTLTQFILDF